MSKDEALARSIEDFMPDGLRKKGRDELTGPCPLCGGDDRFNVQPARNTFLCRKCHPKYGNVIEFVRWWLFGNLPADEGWSKAIAHMTNGAPVGRAKARPREEKPVDGWKVPYWSNNAIAVVGGYVQHERCVELWQAYRPFAESLIREKQLGVGVLPQSQCHHERLIVPVWEDGILVALRGRQIDCDCGQTKADGTVQLHRWLNAGGIKRSLYGVDDIPTGAVVVAVENNADALLLGQTYGWHGIAPTTGAGTYWSPEWLTKIRRAKPKIVIVAFDNDEAGITHGAKRLMQLHNAGIPARQWTWDDDSPKGADIGWYIMERTKSA